MDVDRLNTLNKRSLVTLVVSIFHSHAIIEFLYHTRIMKHDGILGPQFYKSFPYFIYPLCMIGTISYYWKVNRSVTSELDEKYTPIWIEISKELA